MGQDKPIQLGPLERASLNPVFLSSTYKTMDTVQNKPNSSVQHTPSSESFQVQLFELFKTFLLIASEFNRRAALGLLSVLPSERHHRSIFLNSWRSIKIK
jgi:hypothetical protein